jgi:iron only hydrogenase large subunit-like protein
MNDDDFYNVLRDYSYNRSRRDWSWTVDQAKTMDPKLTTQEIYDWLKQLDLYNRKDTDMAYSYSRGYYSEDTNSKAVATAVLEAYADGVSFETLIKKNKAVRQYWYNIQSEKGRVEQARIKEQARLAKLAEKRAEEKAQREEVMAKLSREELEAFGFVKKGKR